jgi:hypothetical protein
MFVTYASCFCGGFSDVVAAAFVVDDENLTQNYNLRTGIFPTCLYMFSKKLQFCLKRLSRDQISCPQFKICQAI